LQECTNVWDNASSTATGVLFQQQKIVERMTITSP